MTRLLDRAPFPTRSTEVIIRSERIRIRANQIVVWITLSDSRTKVPNPASTPFPAVLDTGHNHTLSLQERHLVVWAGITASSLSDAGFTRDRGVRVALRFANIWVHANLPRSLDRLADRPPHLLSAERGIAIYPGSSFPRLPILGLRAIADNRLILKVDGVRREATLRTAFRWWPFLG
jgi:hypothetical protein